MAPMDEIPKWLLKQRQEDSYNNYKKLATLKDNLLWRLVGPRSCVSGPFEACC